MAFKVFTSATLSAAEVNDYLMEQTLIVCTSGTRPSSPAEGWHIYETDTDKVYVHNGSAWVETWRVGAWTSYTPTLSNFGSGTFSPTGAWVRLGGTTIHFRASVTMVSTSGTGTPFGISVPVTPASGLPAMAWEGCFTDASTGSNFPLKANFVSSYAYLYAQSASATYVGFAATDISAVPTAVAVGDVYSVWGTYEAASAT